MNSWQSEALGPAQLITDDELRARVIMLVLANNIDGLRELRAQALKATPVDTDEYYKLDTVYFYLVEGART